MLTTCLRANTARLLLPTSLSREFLPLIPEKGRKDTKVFAATEDVQPDLLFKTLLSNQYVVFRGPLVALQVIYAKLRKEVAKADDLESDKEQLEVDPGRIFMVSFIHSFSTFCKSTIPPFITNYQNCNY